MREILFRGKRIDNGEWVYGSLVNNLWGKGDEKVCEIVTTDVDYYDCWEDLIFGAIVEVIPETVGQFTGVLDKNGDRIFEGDVLKDGGGDWGEVVWNKDDCSFSVDWTLGGLFEALYDNSSNHFEITGNIHDNKL